MGKIKREIDYASMSLIDLVKTCFLDKYMKISSAKLVYANSATVNIVMKEYPEYDNIRDKIYSILNGKVCTCFTCGKIVSYPKFLNRHAYCQSGCGNVSPRKSGRKRTDATRKKIEETNMRKYGSKNFITSEVGKEVILKSIKEKYGVDNVSQLQHIKDAKQVKILSSTKKRRLNLTKKKHVYIKSLGIDIDPSLDLTHISIGHPSKLYDKEMMEVILGLREATIEIVRRNRVHAYPMLHEYGLIESGVSAWQKEIQEFLTNNGIEFIQNDRQLIKPYEVDIYIPSKKVAIECNGLYYHTKHDKDYHLMKTELCQTKGVSLIQIWDCEWNNDKDRMKEIILFNLGLLDREPIDESVNFHVVDLMKESITNYTDIGFIEIYREPPRKIKTNGTLLGVGNKFVYDCGLSILVR